MSATPTPREVLAKWLTNATQDIGDSSPQTYYGADCTHVRQMEREYLAALAAQTGPLDVWQESELNRFIARFEDVEDEATGNCRECHGEVGHELACPIFAVKKLLTAYTTLTAECARLNLLREEHEKMVVAAGERYDALLQHNVRYARDLAALRATVATLQDALKRIKRDGDKSSRYIAEDALELLARTPTPEGQG